MIEEVFISGQLGKAFYKENDLYFSLNAEEKNRSKECRSGEVFSFLKSGFELEVTQDKYVNIDQIRSALVTSHVAHRALTLTIGGLDSELSDDTRLLSIEAAEELLNDDYINNFVKRRLLAFPLPKQADINGAILFSNQTGAKTVYSIFDKVATAQNFIKKLTDICNEVMLRFFDTDEERENAIRILIGIGFFGDVISSIAFENAEKLDSLIISYGLNPEFKKKVNKGIQILNQIKKLISSEIGLEAEKTRYIRDEKKYKPAKKKTPTIDRIYELITTFKKGERNRKKEKLSSIEIKEKVDKQIDAIKNLICRGKLLQANKYLYDLIKYNLTYSNREHVAKTLCNIATAAMNYNKFDLASKLIEYAYLLGIEDIVILCTRAELYKLNAQFDQSLAVYNEATNRFPDDVVVRNGKAEVLKKKGLLHEALVLYDETIDRFPDDAFARCGKAEVLKEKGLLDEALAFYDEMIHRFTDNVISYRGRAEIFKAKGDLDKALEAYEEIIENFPEDSISLSGKAEVLKEKGLLDEALTLYNETIERFPYNVFARSGKAEVLKEKGLLNQALALYDETIERFPDDVVTRNGKAEVIKEKGLLDEALAFYNETIDRFPYDVFARNGKASILVLMDRLDDARNLLLPIHLDSKSDWISYHIVAMSYFKEGDFNEAIKRFQHGIKNNPWIKDRNYFRNALGVVRIKKKEFEEARKVLMKKVHGINSYSEQKRLLLLSHAQAGLDRKTEATDILSKLYITENPHIIKLKDYLFKRFELGGEVLKEYSKRAIEELDRKIEEEEFFFALAA